MLADNSMTKLELLNVLQEFYTPGKQKQYGVVGIRIEKYIGRRNKNGGFKEITKRNISKQSG